MKNGLIFELGFSYNLFSYLIYGVMFDFTVSSGATFVGCFLINNNCINT